MDATLWYSIPTTSEECASNDFFRHSLDDSQALFDRGAVLDLLGGWGFNPLLVPVNPQVFIDPHWFSQK